MKYIKFMADYGSDGVWDEDGIHMDIDEIPLSLSLKQEINEWVSLYETNDDWKDPKERKIPLFDVKEFSKIGLALAKKIKTEVKDEYTVMYFDEGKLKDGNPQYLYEIKNH